MKITSLFIALCIAIAMPTVTWSQTQPATAEAVSINKPLPEVKFDQVKLDDVLEFLHDVNPAFTATLIREPGVSPDYPKVTFRSQNIAIPQFLEFLKAAYGIEVNQIPGNVAGLFLIRVKLDDMARDYVNERLQAEYSKSPPQVQSSMVRVYSLRRVVRGFPTTNPAAPMDDKQRLSEILSLLKATLDFSEKNTGIEYRVHESTQSLIVKGTGEQHGIVENLLGALGPDASEAAATIEKLKAQMTETEMNLQQVRQINRQTQTENDRLRARLDATEAIRSATTKPKE